LAYSARVSKLADLPQQRRRWNPSRSCLDDALKQIILVALQFGRLTTSILKQARRGVKLPSWIISLTARRPYKIAAVTLANKIARTIWALLVKGGIYRTPAANG